MIKIDGKRLALLVWVLNLIFPAAATVQGNDAQGNEELMSFSLPNQTVTLNEPVILLATFENASGHSVKVDLGANKVGAFRFAVTNPDGDRAELKPFSRRSEGIVFTGAVELQPGHSYAHRILLNRWFDFSSLGDYLVEAQLDNRRETGHEQSTDLSGTFRASIKVVARDPERLRARCEILAQEVINSTSVDEAVDGALALSYVRDPVAVPFLQQILEARKAVEQYAITGLQGVGNIEAVSALLAATKITRDGDETGELARMALLNLKAETSDPAIKKLIERALKEAR